VDSIRSNVPARRELRRRDQDKALAAGYALTSMLQARLDSERDLLLSFDLVALAVAAKAEEDGDDKSPHRIPE